MPQKDFPFAADAIPLRAPQRWFKCIEYGQGLKIELPYASEQEAIAAGIAHLDCEQTGIVKIGFYGFRSRVIVYSAAELCALRTQ